MKKINSPQNQTAASALYNMLEFFPKAREATKKRRDALVELRRKQQETPPDLKLEASQIPLKSN